MVDSLVIKADLSSQPLIVEMEGGEKLTYQLVDPTLEQLARAKAAYESLSEESKALDVKAWTDVLGAFMRRDDAARFLREQTIVTLRTVVSSCMDLTAKKIAAQQPKG